VHKPKKAIGKSSKLSKKLDNSQNISDMKQFFLQIWKKRLHVSEVSGDRLYEPVSTAYFHHILPKSKYPEAQMDEENIILMTLNEHANVEGDIYRYEEVNKRRESLKIKYNI
jgi:hypothetical protein